MIRPANLLDVPWLLEQVREFDRFAGHTYSLVPSDETKAIAKLESFITNENCRFFIASDISGPMGFLLAVICPHYFNDELLTMAPLLWWVDPRFRGGTVGARLFEHFNRCAEEEGAHLIPFNLEAHSPISDRAMEKRGFVFRERAFLREVA